MVLSPFLGDELLRFQVNVLFQVCIGFSPVGETGEGSNDKRSRA
jgi:hypothetical protein